MIIKSAAQKGYKLQHVLELQRLGKDRLGADAPVSAPELAVAPAARLTAGAIYPSSVRAEVSYYVPTYQLAEEAGRYQVKLRYLELADSMAAGGAIGRLEVTWKRARPDGTGSQTLLELEHTATARVRYVVPSANGSGGAPLVAPLGPLIVLEGSKSQIVLPIYTKAEFDRWFEVMTREEMGAAIEVELRAQVGVRSSDQLRPAKFATPIRLSQGILNALVDISAPKAAVLPRAAAGSALSAFLDAASPLSPPPQPTTAPPPQAPSPVQPTLSIAAPARLLSAPPVPLKMAATKPALSAAVKKSTLKLKVAGKVRPALSLDALLGAGQGAELTEVSATGQQSRSFRFPLVTNAYAFELGSLAIPSSTTVLLKRPIGALNFYELSTEPGVYLYEAQEFRLPRSEAFPHLPEMVVAVGEVAIEDDSGALRLDYRAEVALRLVPWIDPRLFAEAITLLLNAQPAANTPGRSVNFAPLIPSAVRLELDVPRSQSDGAVRLIAEAVEASVDPDGSLSHSLQLDAAELEAIGAAFRGPDSTGLRGRVRAVYAGGLEKTITARVSLASTAGRTADVAWLGPASGEAHTSEHLIRVRNPLESPVSIDAMLPTPIGPSQLASPVDDPAGRVLSPGESLQMRYRLTPADGSASPFTPMALTTVRPSLDLLWPLLLVQGASASRTFSVHLATDTAYFSFPPGPGIEPLVALKVEFQDGPVVMLHADVLESTVDLPVPFLPRLTGEPHQERYSFRVTNLHTSGEGARTNWIHGSGAGHLVVEPAPLPS